MEAPKTSKNLGSQKSSYDSHYVQKTWDPKNPAMTPIMFKKLGIPKIQLWLPLCSKNLGSKKPAMTPISMFTSIFNKPYQMLLQNAGYCWPLPPWPGIRGVAHGTAPRHRDCPGVRRRASAGVAAAESGDGWKWRRWLENRVLEGEIKDGKMEIVTSLVTSSDTLWACLVFCSDFSCDIRISWGKQWHKLPPLRSSAPSARWLENPPAGKINCKCGIVYCHVWLPEGIPWIYRIYT